MSLSAATWTIRPLRSSRAAPRTSCPTKLMFGPWAAAYTIWQQRKIRSTAPTPARLSRISEKAKSTKTYETPASRDTRLLTSCCTTPWTPTSTLDPQPTSSSKSSTTLCCQILGFWTKTLPCKLRNLKIITTQHFKTKQRRRTSQSFSPRKTQMKEFTSRIYPSSRSLREPSRRAKSRAWIQAPARSRWLSTSTKIKCLTMTIYKWSINRMFKINRAPPPRWWSQDSRTM